jgi:hypothetical protein
MSKTELIWPRQNRRGNHAEVKTVTTQLISKESEEWDSVLRNHFLQNENRAVHAAVHLSGTSSAAVLRSSEMVPGTPVATRTAS